MNETGNEGYISAETVPPVSRSRELVVFAGYYRSMTGGGKPCPYIVLLAAIGILGGVYNQSHVKAAIRQQVAK